jgi:hypothetical protein
MEVNVALLLSNLMDGFDGPQSSVRDDRPDANGPGAAADTRSTAGRPASPKSDSARGFALTAAHLAAPLGGRHATPDAPRDAVAP